MEKDVKRPPFSSGELEAICKILADTYTGMTKWKCLYNALINEKNKRRSGNKVLSFIATTLEPARYINNRELYEAMNNWSPLIISVIPRFFIDFSSQTGLYKFLSFLTRQKRMVPKASLVKPRRAGGGYHEPDKLIEACENSVKRLHTDYIDLYQLHWPNWNVPFEETIGGLKRLQEQEQEQEQGKIRAFGVSNFGPKDLSSFYAQHRCETNQVEYNLLFSAIEYEIKPLCIDNETGILCYSPIAQGLLTAKFATPDDVPDFRARTRLFSGERTQSEHNEKGCEEQVFKAIARIKEISERIGRPMGLVAQA